MNLTELTSAILAESLRTDLTSQIPLFVERAEEMIARELRASEMLASRDLAQADLVVTTVAGVYKLPTDWLEDRVVRIGTQVLRKISSEAIYRVPTGVPQAYAVAALVAPAATAGLRMTIVGSPALTDKVTLDYYARPAALVLGTDSNRLITAHPGLYIDSALFYLYRYTQDLELAQGALDSWLHARDTLNEQAGRLVGGGESLIRYNLGHARVAGGY